MTRSNQNAGLKALVESSQEMQQAMSEKIQMLEQANNALQTSFNTIRDDLLLATQLSLGRMLIEVGIAANDLRDSMPPDPKPNEADLEEGELIADQEPGVSIWKKRLDKMIVRISEAHRKADEELQAVADKMAGMTKEMQHTQKVLTEAHTPLRRSKRIRDLADFQYEKGDGMHSNIEGKKPRYEEGFQQFEPGALSPTMAFEQQDSHGIPFRPIQPDYQSILSDQLTPLERIPLWNSQQPESQMSVPVMPERLPTQDITPTLASFGETGMHADRRWLIENIKVEDEAEEPARGHVVSVGIPETVAFEKKSNVLQVRRGNGKGKWKAAYSLMNINQEESEWLAGPKSLWSTGGWSDRLAWLQAVMGEYRRLKATATCQAEVDSNLRILLYRIRAGEFTPEMFGI